MTLEVGKYSRIRNLVRMTLKDLMLFIVYRIELSSVMSALPHVTQPFEMGIA
jgi:hypothetical protein